MAATGRRAAPANVIAMKGRSPGRDSGGRPIPPVPKFKREPPTAPEWLSDEARAEWDRVVPGLSALDVLKPEDRAHLAAYCESWATFVMATQRIQEDGETIEHVIVAHGPRGTTTTEKTIVNPFIAVRNQAGRELRGFGSLFGLSPSAETALGASGGGTDDDENPFT